MKTSNKSTTKMDSNSNTTPNEKASVSDLTQAVINHLSKVDKLHQEFMSDIEVNFNITDSTYESENRVLGECDNFIDSLINILHNTETAYMDYREKIFDLIGQVTKYTLMESTFKEI